MDVHRNSTAKSIIDFAVTEELTFYEYDEVVAFCEEELLRGDVISTDERAHLIAELLSEFAAVVARQFCEEHGGGRRELKPPPHPDDELWIEAVHATQRLHGQHGQTDD